MIQNSSKKSWITTLILAIFFGFWGIHRFYVGKSKSGCLYLFTMGLGGLGWLADIALILMNQFSDGSGALIQRSPSQTNFNNTYDNPFRASGQGTYYEHYSSNYVHSVDGMDGHQFERFCADLLRKNGFVDVKITPGSGDQGVDIIAVKNGIRYAIQCKNYSSPLGNTPIQEVCAGKMYYKCHVGAVMTNSTFTQGAKQLAEATSVLLWDRAELQRMMKSFEC